MGYEATVAVAVFALFAGMLALQELGRRVGIRRFKADPEGAREGIGTIDGAVFALLGLLVAFTFSGAASRFDARRALVGQEANAIGTAWLRLDLLPPEAQPELRRLFRDYTDARVSAYGQSDVGDAWREYARSEAIQGDIWKQARRAAEGSPPATMLLLPALNEMIDITTTRRVAAQMHPPVVIFALLFGLGYACALLAGYGMGAGRTRNWTHMLAFAGITALTVYVILDIEYPRRGFIRVDAVDQLLVDLRAGMK
ncbi:MAG: DUF4239 domain-containing protein [Deltaproteobacteria bacterium]|nr:DUF4239 domain-containing protein [Deltaproteobacteria bacterium]